jgi:hypothetical protein
MKNMINSVIIGASGLLLLSQITQAQGIVYLSNLSQPPTGSLTVGSDSWLAESFYTGTNSGGYMLNSVQLAMTNAAGNPAGFSITLYSAIHAGEYYPGNSLAALNGNADPANGIFSYVPALSVTLSASTAYFLVLTAASTTNNGAFYWLQAAGFPFPIGNWQVSIGVARPDTYVSSDGLNWTERLLLPQFAITATPIPEPGSLSLFVLGGLGFLWQRRKAKP